MQREVGNDLARHGQLPIREKLDQHRTQQFVVRRCDREAGTGKKTRTKIGQRNIPSGRRLARYEEQMTAAYGGHIENMQQRLLRRSMRIVDDDGSRAFD